MSAAQGTAASRVREAWGGEAPAWIKALAAEADRTSQAKVADMIGYSASVVSQVFKRAYRGDLGRVEQAVRGALMAATVECPGMKRALPTHECLGWQKKARGAYRATNHVETRMFRACRACPRFRQGAAAGEGLGDQS